MPEKAQLEDFFSIAMLRRVLLVEDHDSLRQLLGSFLSNSFEVVGAKNGLEAMAWLSQGLVPDVIVADKETPGLGAAELLRQLKCTGLWSEIPVVVLADECSAEQESLLYKNLGAQAMVGKPFNPLELQEKLLQLTRHCRKGDS